MTIHLNKINGFGGESGGGGGGGDGKFPTIVTDSGSSLPATTGYQEGDTFLNTTDKKLYTTQVGGYALNTNAILQQDVVLDTTSGVASNFTTYYTYTYGVVRSGVSVSWSGSGAKIRVHFKLNALPEDNTTYVLLSDIRGWQGSPPLRYCVDVRIVNKKLNLALLTSQYGTQTVSSVDIADTELLTNQEYYLEIEKNGNVATVTLATGGYGVDVIETNEVETQDHDLTGVTLASQSISVGCSALSTNSGVAFSIGSIYLVDTTGEFVIADTSSLLWNGGESLTNKTEYADKTNGALYLYENSELVKIGGNLTKKVYMISVDNTSTLDVSSDFTKIVDVLKNGVELALTDDYTISSGVITFITALGTTDKITVKGE